MGVVVVVVRPLKCLFFVVRPLRLLLSLMVKADVCFVVDPCLKKATILVVFFLCHL